MSRLRFNWKRDVDFPDGTQTQEASVPILNYGLINLRGTYNAASVASAQLVPGFEKNANYKVHEKFN